ncbi:Elongation factor P [Alphaproteobacteria bacterium]
MKIDANNIRIGNVLEHEGKLWIVLKTMHTQPGKGGAYMQVEMKEIRGGTKLNVRFRSSENVEKAQLDQVEYQYLYSDESSQRIMLMNLETFEQIEVDNGLFYREQLPFLHEGITVTIENYNEKPIVASLPEVIEVAIAECEPAIKGQTITSSFKPAILENGVRIMVPQFINVGDRVMVNTNSKEYLERAK